MEASPKPPPFLRRRWSITKIIDFECKGNIVRFFLGKDGDEDYQGDDWDDRPYESNAGPVYKKYITGIADLAFPFDSLVLEPCADVFNSHYSKDDMKAGKVPCVIVVPDDLVKESWQTSFDFWISCKDILKFYFNDRMEPTKEPVQYSFDPKDRLFRNKEYSTYITRQKEQGVSAEGGISVKEVPIWEKANLTIEEAAVYFGIGRNKLVELTKIRNCNFVLFIGNRRMIKRKQFEAFLERQESL